LTGHPLGATGLATPSIDVFGMSIATIILSVVLLGGAGTIYGAIIASSCSSPSRRR
jgi:ABC-type branched-subunit amino acid transport system permease subunit